jgi:hypothetical protein
MSNFISFYDETINMLTKYNKNINDVLFVRTNVAQCSIEEFLNLIKDYKYKNGYGREYINLDLKIVGDDWWLERQEYDGSEWWVYKEKPKPINTIGVFRFQSSMFD